MKKVQFENTFRVYAEENKEDMLLTKSDFYQLIDYTDSLPTEVKEKLDWIKKYLSN